jgi:hypothetical protein
MTEQRTDYRLAAVKAAFGDPASSKVVNSELLQKAAMFVAMDDGLRPGQVFETGNIQDREYTLWLINNFEISWNTSGKIILEVLGRSIEYLPSGKRVAQFRIDLGSWKTLGPKEVDRETWKQVISETSK